MRRHTHGHLAVRPGRLPDRRDRDRCLRRSRRRRRRVPGRRRRARREAESDITSPSSSAEPAPTRAYRSNAASPSSTRTAPVTRVTPGSARSRAAAATCDAWPQSGRSCGFTRPTWIPAVGQDAAVERRDDLQGEVDRGHGIPELHEREPLDAQEDRALASRGRPLDHVTRLGDIRRQVIQMHPHEGAPVHTFDVGEPHARHLSDLPAHDHRLPA